MTSPCSMRSAPAKQRNPRSSYASKPWDFHSPKLGLAMGHCMGGGTKNGFHSHEHGAFTHKNEEIVTTKRVEFNQHTKWHLTNKNIQHGEMTPM